MTAKITHAMTVDVEDYFHVAAFNKVIDPNSWDSWPCRVEANTHKLLQLFDDKNIKITFFILGWVAERYPELVKTIRAQGHEIASHGSSHRMCQGLSDRELRSEISGSRRMLEEIAG